MVVKCLTDCRIKVSDGVKIDQDEFVEGKLYVLGDDRNLIGEKGNKIPILGFWRNFKLYKPNKRKSKYK
jgi:hypothetical protein